MLLNINGVNLEGQYVDFVIAWTKDLDETEDFINAYSYDLVLTNTGTDLYKRSEFSITREDCDPTTYEYILEIIQPT